MEIDLIKVLTPILQGAGIFLVLVILFKLLIEKKK